MHVIVDPEFGVRLREIPMGEPVWIADTDINRAACETIRRERKPQSHVVGLTSFKVDKALGPEDWLISELETIELHHGEYSRDPSWSRINVIGTRWTKRIQREFEHLGFTAHVNTHEGFETTNEVRQL